MRLLKTNISPRAVQEFIDRPRDDWSWLKNVPSAQLIKELAALNPAPDTSGLMQQQLVGLLIGIACRQFCFFYGPGSGKSLLILRLLEYFRSIGEFKKGLVLVPSKEAVYSWEDEMRAWKSPLKPIPLAEDTSYDKALQWLEADEGLLLAAYPSFCAMVTAHVPKLTKGGKATGHMRMKPQRKSIDMLCKTLNAIILDEATECGDSKSLQARVCTTAATHIPIRFALAGRPFGRDPQMQWSQQYIIDRGASLGPTLGLLRAALFEGKDQFFGGPYSKNWALKPEHEQTFARLAGHRSLHYTTEECVDLVDLVKIIKRFRLPKDTMEFYDRVKNHLFANAGDRMVIKNDFVRLRQLSSGFLGIKDDEARVEVEFERNPKLELTMDIIKQKPENQKVVIFHEFTRSGKEICKRLKKEKIKHVWLWSGTEDRRGDFYKFQNDPTCTVLVLNWMVGAFALNLQIANHVIYFESPIGCIPRDQSERRCWRKGQTKKVLMYDLVMDGGVDERILAFHQDGLDIFQSLTHEPRKVLK
jgi:SNF2 family DNA or RNA helicase